MRNWLRYSWSTQCHGVSRVSCQAIRHYGADRCLCHVRRRHGSRFAGIGFNDWSRKRDDAPGYPAITGRTQ